MSDLSRLLGDVYGPEPEPPAADDEAAAAAEAPGAESEQARTLSGALPGWADDTVLDEAFANWVPGPPADAPSAERGMLSDLAGRPAAEVTPPGVEPRPTTLADAVPEAPDFVFPRDDEPTSGLATAAPARW